MIENFAMRFKNNIFKYETANYEGVLPHVCMTNSDNDNPFTVSNNVTGNNETASKVISSGKCVIKPLPDFSNVVRNDVVHYEITVEKGDEPDAYQWYVKRHGINWFDEITGATGSSLDLQLEDNNFDGAYVTCKIRCGNSTQYFYPIASHITFDKNPGMRPEEEEETMYFTYTKEESDNTFTFTLNASYNDIIDAINNNKFIVLDSISDEQQLYDEFHELDYIVNVLYPDANSKYLVKTAANIEFTAETADANMVFVVNLE